jgi:cytochrome b subunit of formate dehydrogenase
MSRGNTYEGTDIMIYNPRTFEGGLNLRVTLMVCGLFGIGFSAVTGTIMRMDAAGHEFEIYLSIFALILLSGAVFSYTIWEIITLFKIRKYPPNKLV